MRGLIHIAVGKNVSLDLLIKPAFWGFGRSVDTYWTGYSTHYCFGPLFVFRIMRRWPKVEPE